MADFAKVKIGSTWLTDDGTETGDPCMVQTDGLKRLQSEKLGAVAFSANADPKHFSSPTDWQGVIFRVTAFVMDKTVHQAIVAELNGLDLKTDTIQFILESNLGDFDLQAKPMLPDFVDAPETFDGDWIDQVTYILVTTGLTP